MNQHCITMAVFVKQPTAPLGSAANVLTGHVMILLTESAPRPTKFPSRNVSLFVPSWKLWFLVD